MKACARFDAAPLRCRREGRAWMRRGAGDGEDGGGRGGQGEVAGGRRAGTCRGTLESMLARCPPRGPEEPPTGAGAPKRTPRGRGGPTTEHTEHTTQHTEHTDTGPTSVCATPHREGHRAYQAYRKYQPRTLTEHTPSIPRAYREHTASIDSYISSLDFSCGVCCSM